MDLTRRQAELADRTSHHPSIGRFDRGRSAVFNRPNYGTWLRCSCGEQFRSNEAPSAGGRATVLDQWIAHAKAVS